MCKLPLLLVAVVAMCLSVGEPASAQKGKFTNGGKSTTGEKPQNGNISAEAELDNGNAAFDRKEWATAIAHYTSALRQKPDLVPALINRSRASLFSGKLDAAVADSRKACELAPDQPAAHTWLAAALLDKGDHAGAVDSAARALKLDPKQAMAWYVRGTALIHKGEFAKAIDDLSEAAKLSPNDAVIYNNRGIAWQKLGEENKAKADFDRRDQLMPRKAPLTAKQEAKLKMEQAKARFDQIDFQVKSFQNRRLPPMVRIGPQGAPVQVVPQVPPELLQLREQAWKAYLEACKVYNDTP